MGRFSTVISGCLKQKTNQEKRRIIAYKVENNVQITLAILVCKMYFKHFHLSGDFAILMNNYESQEFF